MGKMLTIYLTEGRLVRLGSNPRKALYDLIDAVPVVGKPLTAAGIIGGDWKCPKCGVAQPNRLRCIACNGRKP